MIPCKYKLSSKGVYIYLSTFNMECFHAVFIITLYAPTVLYLAILTNQLLSLLKVVIKVIHIFARVL